MILCNFTITKLMKKSDAGIYGLGAMGIALARNIAHNFQVTIANRTVQTTYDLYNNIKKYKESENIIPVDTLTDLVKQVNGPIILLIPSGDPQNDLVTGRSTTPIDEVIFHGSEAVYPDGKVKKIKPLKKLVNQNHIIIDAGNSHPYSTAIRDLKLSKENIQFLGMGVSGGEMGALKGPSIMPGGAHKTYKKVEKILKSAAAKSGKDICCDWMGPSGAGHLVKIVHNGIEYAIMGGISEAYWLLKNALNLSNEELYKVFKNWNSGNFRSYLLDITVHILNEKDSSGNYILDEILDSAGAKGTGKWTTQISADLGIGASAIYAALEGRQISNKKEKRQKLSRKLKFQYKKYKGNKNYLINQTRDALYSLILIAYIQGFNIISEASNELTYTAPLRGSISKINYYTKKGLSTKIDLVKVSKIWKAGCIIRSNLLKLFQKIFQDTDDILSNKKFHTLLSKYYKNLNKSVTTALELNIPYLATTSALNYYNSIRSNNLPANMIQAQRDLFGAHTFKKIKGSKTHHHYWGKKYSITKSYSK